MKYNKVNRTIKEDLIKMVGRKNFLDDVEKMRDYNHDEFSLKEIAHQPEVVVKPETAEEVSKIIKLANREKIPVTPRGGATGLCGGCVPSFGGIVLSLENMNRILQIDMDNQMAVVEAGVTLSDFYAAVEETGLFFPPHPGDEGAMIGGVIATNAGGSRAVKYGVIRNYVRGLEIVLPFGKIINLGGKLMKSTMGYNLLNLLIGSEGTLGVITKAIIQLMPSPAVIRSLVIPYDDLSKAIEAVPFLIQKQILPMAVEFIPKEVIKLTEDFLNKKWPSSLGNTYLFIILDASSEEEIDKLSEIVGEACLEKGALEIFIADNVKKQEQVLEIRSKIYESIKAYNIETMDIVVPRAEIARHVRKVMEISQKYQIWLPTYGHAADGNVHTHIMRAKFENNKIIPLPEEEWKGKIEKVRDELYRDCKNRGGMISGEHGIGIVKKSYFSNTLDEEEIILMRRIKEIFDPQQILNPGKIFDF